MTAQNTPNPSTSPPGALTVISTIPYPAWWSGATTVEIEFNDGDDTGNSTSDTFAVGDVELFVHGVAFPAGESSANTLVPWHRVFDIHQVS
jgi:hypothetical protein